MDSGELLGMDKLKKMLELQRRFQDHYDYHPPLHMWCSGISAEAGELWAISGGKWWRKIDLGSKEMQEKRLEELADLMHFVLGYMIDADISVDQLFEAYKAKLKINYERQEKGY